MTRGLNQAVAFFLELAVLFAIGYWGFTRPWHPSIRFLVGLGGPLIMAVLWGVFGSPKAPVPLEGFAGAVFRIAWFALGGLAFWVAGRPVWALVVVGVYAVNALMLGSL